jgi:hypothetical protein
MFIQQSNTEYWFRLFYDCLRGACYGSIGVNEFFSFLAHLWIWIIWIGYALSIIGLFFIVYTTMRIFQLRKREEEYYNTVIAEPGKEEVSPRWQRIKSLANGANVSEWREAIIEADIMLDDLLAKQGYIGDGIGEKLKSAPPQEFGTLSEAWEAHKVRNQIAHEGSEFNLSEAIVHRTIARYESVFREFKAI